MKKLENEILKLRFDFESSQSMQQNLLKDIKELKQSNDCQTQLILKLLSVFRFAVRNNW